MNQSRHPKAIRMVQKLTLLLTHLVFSITCLQGQSLETTVIGSGGETFASSQGTLAWTMGEIMTETYQSDNHFLTQGFHQPAVIKVTGIEEETEEPLLVYPNPFVDRITLQRKTGTFNIEVLDLQGRKVKSAELDFQHQHLHSLELENLSPAIYIMRIEDMKTSILYHVKLEKL